MLKALALAGLLWGMGFCTSKCNAQAASQQHSPVERDAQALTVLSSAYQRLAGTLGGVPNDVHLVGSYAPSRERLSSDSPNFDAKLIPRSFMISSQHNGHKSQYIVKRGHGETVLDGKSSLLHLSSTYGLTSGLFPLYERWISFRASNVQVLDHGITNFHGEQCRTIEVDDHGDFYGNIEVAPTAVNHRGNIIVYISSSSGDLYGVHLNSAVGADSRNVQATEFVYGGYIQSNGLWIPTQIDEYQSRGLVSSVMIQSIVINSGFTEGDIHAASN